MSAERFLKVMPRARSNGAVEPVIRRDATGLSLYAARDHAPGEVVFAFRNVVWRLNRDQFTVEHPSGAHLYHPMLAKTAHACDPNGRLDVRQRVMVALRPIAAGERVSFDYATTERRISHPFQCLCGVPRCRGWIG